VCLSVVLPMFYCLVSTSHLWSSGAFCAMDSGANIFIFLPVFEIRAPISPSLHCLTSVTSWPAHLLSHSAEVMVNMHDSVCAMSQMPQHAFIPSGLLFDLFRLSTLGAPGCHFDFHDVLGLQCGSMFLFFSLSNGLYLAANVSISLDCSDFSTFVVFNSDKTVIVAQTRFQNVSLPKLVVLPVPINLPASVGSVQICLLLHISSLMFSRYQSLLCLSLLS